MIHHFNSFLLEDHHPFMDIRSELNYSLSIIFSLEYLINLKLSNKI